MYNSFIAFQKRLRLALKKQATPVILNWVEFTGTPTIDETTGAKLGETTNQTETVRGFVHFVQPAKTGVRLFEEMETGDAIVDLPPDTEIEGRAQLEFVIDGEIFVQKELGGKLAKHYDALVQGEKTVRTLLLTKKK